MIKKTAKYIPYLIIVLLLTYHFFPHWFGFGKPPLYIAAVGPMSGPQKTNGQAMVTGIQMHLEKINATGGIDGRKVKLRIFDDKNNVRQAMKIASEIEEDNDILLVLGHYFSSTSIAAGRTYRKKGIPAITASGTAEGVTDGNDWYFRTVPHNGFQGAFIANYIRKALKEDTVTIIHDTDQYGLSLAESFEEIARHEGMVIRKKWGFASDHKKVGEEVSKIVTELRALNQPGAIFLATHADEAAQIISSLKYPGTKYTIIGADALSSDTFIQSLNTLPSEQARPGYYSDGLYTITPFMFDIADENAIRFRKDYIRRYSLEPTWVSACYYDAAHIALEAIRLADVQGKNQVRRDRREIRSILANISSYEDAVKGLTGYLFFDRNGDFNGPLAMGIYERQKLYPAFSQYQLIPQETRSDEDLEKVLAGDMLLIENKLMHKTSVVYAGIDINNISELDIRNSTYTVDFYLWFRYKREFDAANIQFINAASPIRMKPVPLNRPEEGDLKVEAFEVQIKFKSDFDFRNYPCEKQLLKITFRHAELTRGNLIFVVDTRGMPSTVGKELAGKTNLSPISGWSVQNSSVYQDVGWYVKDQLYYQDIISNASTLGMPEFFQSRHTISYSQFNAAIRIERKGWGTMLRNFMPLLLILAVLYSVFFIPHERQPIRLWLLLCLLVINAVYHVNLIRNLPVEYITLLEWTHIALYLIICLTIFYLISIFALQRKQMMEVADKVTKLGKTSFPLVTFLLLILLIRMYFKGSGAG